MIRFTQSQLDDIAKRWIDGESSGQIAAVYNVSRNTIIGRVHRMKLPKRERPVNSAMVSKATDGRNSQSGKYRGIQQKAVKARAQAKKKKPEPEITSAPEPPVASAEHPRFVISPLLTLMEINEHTCKWPIGDPHDPDFGFCGKTPLEGKPYCAEHADIAFVTPETLVRKKVL